MSAINGRGLLIDFGGRVEQAVLGSQFLNAQVRWAGRLMKFKLGGFCGEEEKVLTK